MAKRKRGRVKKGIGELLDLPAEVVLNLPRFELLGDDRLYIENHKGVVEYTAETVRINTEVGVMKIVGRNLSLRNIASEDIIVLGTIDMMELIK